MQIECKNHLSGIQSNTSKITSNSKNQVSFGLTRMGIPLSKKQNDNIVREFIKVAGSGDGDKKIKPFFEFLIDFFGYDLKELKTNKNELFQALRKSKEQKYLNILNQVAGDIKPDNNKGIDLTRDVDQTYIHAFDKVFTKKTEIIKAFFERVKIDFNGEAVFYGYLKGLISDKFSPELKKLDALYDDVTYRGSYGPPVLYDRSKALQKKFEGYPGLKN